MKLRHLFSFVVALAAVSPEATAYADDPPKAEDLPKRQAVYTWDKNEKTGQTLLKATYSYRDVVDKSISDKLVSGLTQTLVMRAFVLREGDKTPIALAGHTCNISYQLWEDVFLVTVDHAPHATAIANVAGVLRQCAEVKELVVADKALLTGNKPFFLGVLVEVNPISAQMLEQMKQWVSRPAGSTGIGPGDALFGSFVGLFLKQIGNADKTLRFRTQSVTPP